MKILVVDDSNIARKMTIKTINEVIETPTEIIQASNGLEACKAYEKLKPDLVFMDLTMPVMDGFEAIEKIKEMDANAKIITVSADIQKGAMDKARELGVLGFIKKPINNEKVKEYFEKIGL